jgi:hypothetical protein
MPRHLYLVALEGPESRYKGGPETMGVWATGDTPEEAEERVWGKVTLRNQRSRWRCTGVVDHGPPRHPDQVDHVVDEPTPGIRMERLVAYPWAEYPGDMAVTATPGRDGGRFTLSWPGGGGHTPEEGRDLATSLLAVADAAEERGW